MATDEGSLLAAARAEGKVLVASGTEIALTKGLYVRVFAPDYNETKGEYEYTKEVLMDKYHCERRPSSGPRAAVGAGAEGRVWAVGAQAWSAPR